MQHILIPTDFSKNAWNAIQYGLKFFKTERCTFHFLHIDISLQTKDGEYLHTAGFTSKKEVTKELKIKMNDLVETVYNNFPNRNHSFKKTIIQAPFVEGLREYIKNNNIHLMVMGTKGATGLKEITIGSRAGAIITKVKCPILVIPEKATFKVPLNIGFPTDFNLNYNNIIINTLLDIAKIHNASIKVLRVAQTQQPLDDFQKENRELLKSRLNDIPYSFHVIENPNLEDALQSFVSIMNVDMIAMIAKNLNFFQRILFKPKVTQISYHTQIPFLVLHE